MPNQLRDIVIGFYQNLYGDDECSVAEGFLCRKNNIFMHPVLTPNFYLNEKVNLNVLGKNRERFLKEFNQQQHWLQLFPEQIDDTLLTAAGYRPSMTCSFNVFLQPLVREQKPTVDVIFADQIPSLLRETYESKTELNCHNLPIAVLRQIESVLGESSCRVSYGLALSSPDNLVGAVTKVRAGQVTLFINGWVEREARGWGIMRQVFAAASAEEFAAGQTAVFYWTLNPIIAHKGALMDQVTVYSSDAILQ